MSEIVQGTPEWHAVRCGKVTASRVADVIAKTKTGVSALRATYMGQLIAERLTGIVQPSFTNAAMEHGTATEAEARAAYEFYYGVEVEAVGFVNHPTIHMCGASPDGRVGTTGLVEIKCPNTATHAETLLSGKIPAKYITQMMWQMTCDRRDWCDYVSYDPRLPEHMRMFCKRVERDTDLIIELGLEVHAFVVELDEKIAALRIRYPAPDLLAAAS